MFSRKKQPRDTAAAGEKRRQRPISGQLNSNAKAQKVDTGIHKTVDAQGASEGFKKPLRICAVASKYSAGLPEPIT